MPRALPALPLLLAMAVATPAFADGDKAARAEALFREALVLMKEGRHAEACPKLAKSQRLDPGAGTQYRLAECYERAGRVGSAWKLYNETIEAARKAGRKDREAQSRARADALSPRVPRVLISIADETASLPTLNLSLDGQELPREAWVRPIPINPGPHSLSLTALGKRSWKQDLNIGEGASVTIRVPRLEAEPPLTAAPAPPATGDKPGPSRALIIVGSATGAAAFVVGLGLMAGSFVKAGERDDALAAVPGGACKGHETRCIEAASRADHARVVLANGSLYTLITAGVISGATLAYALWPRKSSTKAQPAFLIKPAFAGAMVSGQW